MQLRAATKLVKKYGEVPVINALKTWQGKKVWSLNAPWLVDLIVQEKQKYESGQEKLGVAEHNRVESPKTPEKKFSNNLMNDLD